MSRQQRTTRDGVRIYSKLLLGFYDVLIMRILTPYVWRCHARHYLQLYREQMSSNHADIGVGSGYCLQRCHYQPGEVRIALIDLQQNCLDYTKQRLARYQPETYQRDASQSIHIDADAFDSIALGGILHCMPGDLRDKGSVFDALQPISHAQTRVFGYTILNKDVRKTWLSRSVFYVLHKLKVINGIDDSAQHLNVELKKRFARSCVKVIGQVAIFSAAQPLYIHA